MALNLFIPLTFYPDYSRFCMASVKISTTHEPLDHVLDVEKKKKFFSKFEIKEEIVVIFSKTVGPGLLPAPTTMNSDFLVLKSADVGPFFFAGNEFCPAPQLRFVASPKNYILLEPEIFYL